MEADLTSSLVIDILERVGADASAAALRAACGNPQILTAPVGLPPFEEDSVPLVSLVEAVLRRVQRTTNAHKMADAAAAAVLANEALADSIAAEASAADEELAAAIVREKEAEAHRLSLSIESERLRRVKEKKEEEEAIAEAEADAKVRRLAAVKAEETRRMALELERVEAEEKKEEIRREAQRVAEAVMLEAEQEAADAEAEAAEVAAATVLREKTALLEEFMPRRVLLATQKTPVDTFLDNDDDDGYSDNDDANNSPARPVVRRSGWGDTAVTAAAIPSPAAAPATARTHTLPLSLPPPPQSTQKTTNNNDILECELEEDDEDTWKPSKTPVSSSVSKNNKNNDGDDIFSDSIVSAAITLAVAEGGGRGALPLSADEAAALRMSLVGHGSSSNTTVGALPTSWLTQGLPLSVRSGVRYGFEQAEGGPCGPLAVLNGEAVKRLFFGDRPFARVSSIDARALLDAAAAPWIALQKNSVSDAKAALDAEPSAIFGAVLGGLADSLWRSRPNSTASVRLALPPCAPGGAWTWKQPSTGTGTGGMRTARAIDGSALNVAHDGLTEFVSVVTVSSRAALVCALAAHARTFFSRGGGGLPLIVYSALLTRGLENVAEDAGNEKVCALLNAQLGYATQELVSLLLLGRAVPHTVDGDVECGGTMLHGAPARADIGFLTVHAALGLTTVGENLLSPRAPVWVTYGESHYSLLFAAPERVTWPVLGVDAKPRRTFGLKSTAPVRAASDERCLGEALVATLSSAANGNAEPFDMLVWDGLACQNEMVRVTIEPGGGKVKESGGNVTKNKSAVRLDAELSALELWVVSKWGSNSRVCWNESEPQQPLSILP